MAEVFEVILLTGIPGVGKSTLIRKIAEILAADHRILCSGFYTEEVRNPLTSERIGFDVASFEHKKIPFARSGIKINGPYVGKYGLHIRDFEDFVLPLLKEPQGLLIIDEIGKMELKSRQFELAVRNCINRSVILATIPLQTKQPLPFVEYLKHLPQAKIITVTKENRNKLIVTIVESLVKVIKC